MTFDGGGRVAPALRHSNSHTTSTIAITTTGGTMWAARSRSPAVSRVVSGCFGRASGSTVAETAAALAGGATTRSVLRRGIFIASVSASASRRGRRPAAPCFDSHLDALDREAFEVGGGVL